MFRTAPEVIVMSTRRMVHPGWAGKIVQIGGWLFSHREPSYTTPGEVSAL